MIAWLVALLVAVVPPGKVPARESAEAGLERYESIAADIATVTRSPRTAALLVAVAVHESGLRLDVDTGETLGDAGRARGLWQLQGIPADLPRVEQAAIALDRIQRSHKACAGNADRFRLAAYASGSCSRGLPESAAIVDSWRRMLGAHPPPRELGR
jgi:hypothetical protein